MIAFCLSLPVNHGYLQLVRQQLRDVAIRRDTHAAGRSVRRRLHHPWRDAAIACPEFQLVDVYGLGGDAGEVELGDGHEPPRGLNGNVFVGGDGPAGGSPA